MPALHCPSFHTHGSRSTTEWRLKHNEFLDDLIDKVGNDSAMTKLEDFTGALFANKSAILGRLVQGLIETKHGHLLDQEYCDCQKCNKPLKRHEKRSRNIETMVGKFELIRPYFYCRDCHYGFSPLDKVLCLSDSPKQ